MALDIVGPPEVDPFLDPDGVVAGVLSRMRPNQVAALGLAGVHGMTHGEIAAILHNSPRQVKSLMFRARRAFQREWASVDETEGVQIG